MICVAVNAGVGVGKIIRLLRRVAGGFSELAPADADAALVAGGAEVSLDNGCLRVGDRHRLIGPQGLVGGERVIAPPLAGGPHSHPEPGPVCVPEPDLGQLVP